MAISAIKRNKIQVLFEYDPISEFDVGINLLTYKVSSYIYTIIIGSVVKIYASPTTRRSTQGLIYIIKDNGDIIKNDIYYIDTDEKLIGSKIKEISRILTRNSVNFIMGA